jgi:hypothetical protein
MQLGQVYSIWQILGLAVYFWRSSTVFLTRRLLDRAAIPAGNSHAGRVMACFWTPNCCCYTGLFRGPSTELDLICSFPRGAEDQAGPSFTCGAEAQIFTQSRYEEGVGAASEIESRTTVVNSGRRPSSPGQDSASNVWDVWDVWDVWSALSRSAGENAIPASSQL